MPTAVPTMPDSASGVSITRASPKSFWRFSVTRKTPPSLPMSSPMRTTLESFSMARRRPALMPLAMVSLVISGSPRSWRSSPRTRRAPPRRAGAPRRRCGRTSTAARGRHRQAALADPRGQLVGLAVHSVVELLVRLAAGGEVGLEPGDGVAQLPHLDLGRDAVLRRVVGGGVGAHPVGERLHHGGPLAGPRGLERRL